MDIGERIKTLRENNHLSKSALAKKIEVSPAYITMLENGKKSNPSYDILSKIADALYISLEELLNDGTTSFSSKLIAAILRMDYITIVGESDEYGFETITHHTAISIDSLKNCIENNINLPINEQIKLIEFWGEWASNDDGVDLEDFIHDNFKEISKNPLLSRKINKISHTEIDDNKDKIIDLLEDNDYEISMESSDGISIVTISSENGAVSEMLEVDFFNFGNDYLKQWIRFTRFSVDEFVKKHNGPRK